MKNYLKNLAASAITPLAVKWAEKYPSQGKMANETGARLVSDAAMMREIHSAMFVDTERRSVVETIRDMDRKDGRVKMIHARTAADIIRGGLVMQTPSETIAKEWERFAARLQLNNWEKLKSDAKGMLMEGNLALQLVLTDDKEVGAAIRMPSETLVPMVGLDGRFKTPGNAFEQRDVMTGKVQASFAAWQMAMGRLDPDNWDDLGSMGRPMLDSSAATWRKLVMTEEDLVIRRRMRAPLRLSHVLEGGSKEDLEAYRQATEGEKGDITTDFYANRKGGVTAVQGDATLGDIGDVTHLMTTFFAGAPLPKALLGYSEYSARDVLEDMKRHYYDCVDGYQDAHGGVYAFAFRIHLLLKGIDPDPDDFYLRFSTRRTESANQVADLALKWMALGLPDEHIFAEMGLDPQKIRAMKIKQATSNDPYPNPLKVGTDGLPPGQSADNKANVSKTNVSITPSNARKGESATTTDVPGSNNGKGRA